MTEEQLKVKRQHMIDIIEDNVSNILYYDRKECDVVSVKEIEKVIDEETALIMSRVFKDTLLRGIKMTNNKTNIDKLKDWFEKNYTDMDFEEFLEEVTFGGIEDMSTEQIEDFSRDVLIRLEMKNG